MCRTYAKYFWQCDDEMTSEIIEDLKIGWCAKRKFQEGCRLHTGSYSPCSVREIVFNADDNSQATYKHDKKCGYCEGHFEMFQYDLVEAEIKEWRGKAEEEDGVPEQELDIIFSDLKAHSLVCFDDYFRDETSARYKNMKTRLENHTSDMQRKVHSLILKTRAEKSQIRNKYGKVKRQG